MLKVERSEVLAVLLALLSILLFFVGSAQSQVLGLNYEWSDSMTVNNTGRDSTFVTVWESVNFWFRGGEGWIRSASSAAGDTANWNSKKWKRLADNQVVSWDAGLKLKRLQFKAATGTVQAYFSGYKKVRQ